MSFITDFTCTAFYFEIFFKCLFCLRNFIYYKFVYGHLYTGVSRLVDITAAGDFLGLCDQKSSYKHVSDFGRLRIYGHF